MQKIKICCTSGITLPISEMVVYSGKLKKHSQLEIERLCDSIVNDGFLFPIAIGKVDGKNYVVDGECTLFALQELEYRGYEIPEVPVYFVKCNKDTIKKAIVIGTSINHTVTKYSLMDFIQDEEFLKSLAFSEGQIIDFHTRYDIDVYLHHISEKTEKKYIEGMKMELL